MYCIEVIFMDYNTLLDMAVELGMRVDYKIENEPKTIQGQTIEQTIWENEQV